MTESDVPAGRCGHLGEVCTAIGSRRFLQQCMSWLTLRENAQQLGSGGGGGGGSGSRAPGRAGRGAQPGPTCWALKHATTGAAGRAGGVLSCFYHLKPSVFIISSTPKGKACVYQDCPGDY